MQKLLRRITMIVVPVIMAALMAMPAAAMEFSVKAILPENQRNNGSVFFDLLVKPGQKQDLMIEISNSSSGDIVVLVETITASTSRNGQINYTSRGELDESIEYSFEDLVSLPQSYYPIPALSSIQVPISLTIPNEPFEGAMLGSIRVLREATQEEKDAAGAIVNQYAHVTAVRLVMDDNAEDIPADFVLGDINAELVNYRASIIANIRNTQPRIIKDATATASIYHKGSEQPIFEHNQETLDFAPNSIFPYSFVDREGYGIEAGDYTAVISIGHEGENWNFRQDFTILPGEAAAVNDGAVNQHGQLRPGTEDITSGGLGIPMWAVIAIAVGAAILAAVVVLIVLMAKRKPVPAA